MSTLTRSTALKGKKTSSNLYAIPFKNYFVKAIPASLSSLYKCLRFIKLFGWLTAFVQSLLIIASRKHYTVDVVVAWYEFKYHTTFLMEYKDMLTCLFFVLSPFRYTVNLVVFYLDKKLPGFDLRK